jgi:hypothetical protein
MIVNCDPDNWADSSEIRTVPYATEAVIVYLSAGGGFVPDMTANGLPHPLSNGS